MGTHLTARPVSISKRARLTSALSTSKRLGRIPFGSLTWAVLAIAFTAALGTSAGVAQSDANSLSTVHYAIGERACKPAPPGKMTCFAMRRIEVTAGTPGARPFLIAAGANLWGHAPAGSSPEVITIGPHNGLTPYDLATAYNFNSSGSATGQTVAIVDAYNDPNIEADLGTFDTEYGLSSCTKANGCLKVVGQTGSTTVLPPNDTSGWTTEIALDVETVHAVCQNCKILLVEANSNSNADLSTAENEAATLKATVISNSFGGAETGITASQIAAYNHPGIVIVASSGDDGYYSFDKLAEINQPNSPSSLNTVVAVGGTSLYLGQTAVRQDETVWNDNGTRDFWQGFSGQSFGASGGGCSTVFSAPAWQQNLSTWWRTVCGSKRLVSDIAAVGDYLTGLDVYNSYNCGSSCWTSWNTVGGTSLSAPIISAMFALAGGSHGVKYPALTLYGHFGGASLYNVTSGGNGWCGGEGASTCGNPNTLGEGILDCDYPASGTTPSAGDAACDAMPGFNGPTGVGTPIGLGAFLATGPTATITGPSSVTHGATTNTWNATTTDPFPAGKVTSFSWNWGDGSSPTVTTTGSAKHAYTATGTYTITLTVTDNYGITGSKTFAVKVT